MTIATKTIDDELAELEANGLIRRLCTDKSVAL